jgi:hypothetical protein
LEGLSKASEAAARLLVAMVDENVCARNCQSLKCVFSGVGLRIFRPNPSITLRVALGFNSKSTPTAPYISQMCGATRIACGVLSNCPYSRVNGTSSVPDNLELENIFSLFDPYKRHSVVFQDLNDLVHWNANILTKTSSSSMDNVPT